jgi:hypothetical protein
MFLENCILYLYLIHLMILQYTNRNDLNVNYLDCRYKKLFNKPLIIFNMNGVLLHRIYKISLQNKSIPRNPYFDTSTNI